MNDYEFDERLEKNDILKILHLYKTVYNINDDKQVWFDKIKQMCSLVGFCDNMKEYKNNPSKYKGSVADLSSIIRVGVTSKKNTPDLYYLLQILGQGEVERRINNTIKLMEE